jgi:DNA mismatch endonuclease (patch repair protein)
MKRKSIRARAPKSASSITRRVMLSNRGLLVPEKTLAAALRKAGFRFVQNARPIEAVRCTADFVFPRKHTCVFLDGCFWHGCPDHFVPPRRNRKWWSEKIQDNRVRDRRQRTRLKSEGWRVVSVWEHELTDIGRVLARIQRSFARA